MMLRCSSLLFPAAFAMITPTGQALAQSPDPQGLEQSTDTCAQIEELAETVMLARQRGVPMGDVMGRLQKGLDPDGSDYKMFTLIGIEAYGTPQYSSTEMREGTAKSFATKFAIMCYKAKEKMRQ